MSGDSRGGGSAEGGPELVSGESVGSPPVSGN